MTRNDSTSNQSGSPAVDAAHQQLERTVGDLEVVALVLELLELLDDLGELRAVELEAELLRLQHERRLARELGHDEAGAVADERRATTCSYASGRLAIALGVQPGLVRERRVADVRAPAG